MKTTLVVLGSIIGVAVIVGLIYFGPDIHRHFGERYANADREIHQTSLSYVRGTAQNLQRLRLAHETAETTGHKQIIRQTALQEVATVDETKLPMHLQQWVQQLRHENTRREQ